MYTCSFVWQFAAIRQEPGCNFVHRSFDGFMPLGIMEPNWGAFSISSVLYSCDVWKGFRGVGYWSLIMPRGVSMLGSWTPDRCRNSNLGSEMSRFGAVYFVANWKGHDCVRNVSFVSEPIWILVDSKTKENQVNLTWNLRNVYICWFRQRNPF